MVVDRISAYLQGKQTLGDLVSWAEDAMHEGGFDEPDFTVIRDVVARLGLADRTSEIASFGWVGCLRGDCLRHLGVLLVRVARR